MTAQILAAVIFVVMFIFIITEVWAFSAAYA